MARKARTSLSVRRSLFCAALVACAGGTAWPADLRLGGSATVVSDYVYRGVTQNRGQAATQIDLHARPLADWTVGAWLSQVQYLPRRKSAELDFYTRWRWLLPADLSATAGLTYYTQPGDPRVVPYRYTELNATLQWRDRLALAVAWTPKVNLFAFGRGVQRDRTAWSTEMTASQRLPAGLIAQAGFGYYGVVGLQNAAYAYGNAGLSRRFGRLRAELSYIWVQDAAHRVYTTGARGGPLAGSLSWQF